MAIKTRKLKDLPKQGVSALIYGEGGIGKTTFLGTLPGKTLILDLDQGTRVLKGSKADIDIAFINEDLSNILEIFDTLILDHKKLGYTNVCLDTLTELEKSVLINLGRLGSNNGVPCLKDYLECGYKLQNYMVKLRQLREAGVNIFVTAWEMPLELHALDGEVNTKAYPYVSKKLAIHFCGMFDIVAHLELSKKIDGARFLRTQQSEHIFAKDRLFPDRQACTADATVLLTGKLS